MVLKILAVLIFVSTLMETKSAKILAVFPMPSISHQVVFRKFTQELAKRGHEVIVVTPDPAFPNGDAPKNFKEINVHNISYKTWSKLFQTDYKADGNNLSFGEQRHICLLLAYIFEKQLQSPEIQALIAEKDNTFDLIIIEAIIRPALVFSYIFKAPVILISSLGFVINTHNVMGLHTHPILYPSLLQKRLYNLTLAEKLYGLYNYYYIEYANYLTEGDENEMLKKIFGPTVPSLNKLYSNIDMLFINIHPIWADNQPVPPNVVYMGGMYHAPEKELPKDLKAYLDSSKHGVIYLSFGTNIRAEMISLDKLQIIVKVLSELPQDVLWKWDEDYLPGQSHNIRISKWYPQSDLLRHPKIKLFITQAGLQSTEEAINAGVPLIAIPLLGDQWYNAEKYVKHGIGKKLDIESITEQQFRSAVQNVIQNDNYRKNILKFRDFLQDQPISPLKKAVWWTEYVIRHGGAKHLRATSANIPYAQYFEIEIVLISISAIIIISILFVLGVTFVLNSLLALLKVFTKPGNIKLCHKN